MYPEDVAALFASVPVGTKVWLINEPVKIAYVDGKLLLEVHPPVDGDGQVAQVDPGMMSQKLRAALGQDTAAIHWEFTRKALESAGGFRLHSLRILDRQVSKQVSACCAQWFNFSRWRMIRRERLYAIRLCDRPVPASQGLRSLGRIVKCDSRTTGWSMETVDPAQVVQIVHLRRLAGCDAVAADLNEL